MQQKKPKNNPLQNEPLKIYEYEVCDVQSAGCINKFGMYVSQPWKYAGTHILLHCGMILHYYATFSYLHLALGIINIILHILCTLVLVKLAFTDPGMIPKIFPSYQKLAYRKIPTNYQRYAHLLKYYHKNYRTVIKGHNLQLKFCNTCNIYRPPRTVHCQDCGICVQKFDHHCPWIGTCVAKKNYKYFIFFLIVLSALTIKIFIESIVVSVRNSGWDEAEVIAKSVINIFLCIYIFPAMGFAVFMLGLHLKFAATNVTTNQFCKQTWQTLEGNPFKKQSWLKNIFKMISLHYQGKVTLQQRVYNRNDRILLQNDSINSFDDTRQINKTNDNLKNLNNFESKSHKNYETNYTSTHTNQHQMRKIGQKTDKIDKRNQKIPQQKDNKPKNPVQQQEKNEFSYDEAISIYDIGIKIQSGGKDQSKRLNNTANNDSQSSSSHSSSQKPSTSVLSQKDRQEYASDEIQRQQEHKLKVIIEENQTDQNHQEHAQVRKKGNSPQKINSPHKPRRSISIIKMDSEQSSEFGSRVLGGTITKKQVQQTPNLNQNDKNVMNQPQSSKKI